MIFTKVDPNSRFILYHDFKKSMMLLFLTMLPILAKLIVLVGTLVLFKMVL